MQDELIESIRRFSVSGDPLSTASAEAFVDAFAPLSHTRSTSASDAPSASQNGVSGVRKLKQARSTALLTLASRSSSTKAGAVDKTSGDDYTRAHTVDENLAQLLTPVIRSRLADTSSHSLLSALSFLSSLFSVLPSEAHDILTADGIVDLVIEAPDACNALDRNTGESTARKAPAWQLPSDRDLVTFAVAELVSSAANLTSTRKFLAGQQAVLDWLDINCVSRNPSRADLAGPDRRSDAIAVLAGLADIKIARATASEAVQAITQPSTSQPTSQQEHIRKIQEDKSERKRRDGMLFQTVRSEMVAVVSQFPASQEISSVEAAALAQHHRIVQLGCLEVLAYLTVQSTFKESVAADSKLLEVLCTGFELAVPKASQAKQQVDIDSQRFDGALQLGLATIFSNITAYPPSLTAEEQQVRRLRKFADAHGVKHGRDQADDDEQLESISKAEKRCNAVLEAKGVEVLSALAVAGPPPSSDMAAGDPQLNASSWKVNPSKSVRRACGDALLALMTKQDRVLRGKAVQQGALKAVLALSAPVLHSLLDKRSQQQTISSGGLFSRASQASGADVGSEDLAPLQTLAKLLISLNPSLLFPSSDGLQSVASVVSTLLLCKSATRLQKFEALLALTNLASISPGLSLRIAEFSLPSTDQSQDQEADGKFSSTSVLAQACEQLLVEDHAMVRRAWIELLVNLLQTEEAFRFFISSGTSSSTTPGSATSGTDDTRVKLILRLRVLLGLSEVDDWAYLNRDGNTTSNDGPKAGSTGGGSEEPSLATRMACLAILAMVTESDVAISALLTVDRLFPILLASLVLDRSGDAERNEWERADLQPRITDPKRSAGDDEAQVQLNAINLGVRASHALYNVLQYLNERGNAQVKGAGGFNKGVVQCTLQDTLTHHIVQLKKGTGPPQVEGARKGLLEALAECLKLARNVKDA